MADVFISYVEEDSTIAIALSRGLEAEGYSTWCYERHSVPGPSYPAQTRVAISESRVFMIVLSKDSLDPVRSFQVEKEVVRAHETGKRFLPVLHGITHLEFQRSQPEWAQAAGGATGIQLRDARVDEILPRIIRGLKMLHVEPHQPRPAEPISVAPPPPITVTVPEPAPPGEVAPSSVRASEPTTSRAPGRRIPTGVTLSRRAAFGASFAAAVVIALIITQWTRSTSSPGTPPAAEHTAPPKPTTVAEPSTPRLPLPLASARVTDADDLRRLAVNFAGVRKGETIQQFIARFGKPGERSAGPAGKTFFYFDAPRELLVAARDDNGQITSVNVEEPGVRKLRARGVNDPILDFVGQSKQQLVATLGPPHEISTDQRKSHIYRFPEVHLHFEFHDRATCSEIWVFFQ